MMTNKVIQSNTNIGQCLFTSELIWLLAPMPQKQVKQNSTRKKMTTIDNKYFCSDQCNSGTKNEDYGFRYWSSWDEKFQEKSNNPPAHTYLALVFVFPLSRCHYCYYSPWLYPRSPLLHPLPLLSPHWWPLSRWGRTHPHWPYSPRPAVGRCGWGRAARWTTCRTS